MLSELQKGFTLMELLVVVAIIAVLMGIVSASVTGTKSQSVEGQVKSDGRASQIAVDNFSPNPPKDTDGRREGSGRGWVRELQGRWPGVLG